MEMKKIKLIVLALLSAIVLKNVYAQQEPQYSQYMFNMMSVNPAYAGTREALNALVLSRFQWIGMDGAPRSHTFVLHTPVKDKKIGIGMSVINDYIGPVRNTYLNLNYAYRISLNEKLTLSMGLKGGIYNYYVGLTDLNINESDVNFNQDFKKNLQPNLGTGFYLYSDDYYLGISVPKLIKSDLQNEDSDNNVLSEIRRHYFISAGYMFDINSDWKFKPSLLNKMVEGAPPSLDVTAQALYKGQVWLGTTYRIGDAVVFLFEIQVNRQIIVGYSYDVTISEMNNVTNGSHEFLISYDFAGFTNEKVKSPRYF